MSAWFTQEYSLTTAEAQSVYTDYHVHRVHHNSLPEAKSLPMCGNGVGTDIVTNT